MAELKEQTRKNPRHHNAPPPKPKAKPWPWIKRLIWIALFAGAFFYLGLPLFFAGDGGPGLPPLLTEAEGGALIQAARAVLMGQPAPAGAPIEGIVGAAVGTYGTDGPRHLAACFGKEARAAVACAADKLRNSTADFGTLATDRVSVHLLRELRPAKPLWLREMGIGHSRGLYSVVVADGKGARLLTDTQMHVGGFTVTRALQALQKKSAGAPLTGTAPQKGSFLAPTESFTEYDNRPVKLYRASNLLPPVEPRQFMTYLKLGGDYLAGILQDNNQFRYEGDVGHDRYSDSYNLLRHAGTVYSLYQLYLATNEPRYRETADGAWQWVLSQMGRETDSAGRPCAFPVEKAVNVRNGEKKTTYAVKLGGTGLTLIALAEKLTIAKSEADINLGRALANHILRSQNTDGSFESYWSYKTTKAKKNRSIYYPGEAMLGLMRFYQHDPDPRYLDCVERGVHYFLNERFKILGVHIYIPLDAWLMIALNEIDKVKPRDEYVDYSLKLADQMINDQINRDWEIFYSDYDGGFWPYPPAVTPAGSRMEGLTACYLAAKRHGRETGELKEAIRRGSRFEIERIVRPEFAHLYPNPRRALGAFRSTPVSNAIRIDNNQHNISGLLVAAQILQE